VDRNSFKGPTDSGRLRRYNNLALPALVSGALAPLLAWVVLAAAFGFDLRRLHGRPETLTAGGICSFMRYRYACRDGDLTPWDRSTRGYSSRFAYPCCSTFQIYSQKGIYAQSFQSPFMLFWHVRRGQIGHVSRCSYQVRVYEYPPNRFLLLSG
jgi:hypothetical protein